MASYSSSARDQRPSVFQFFFGRLASVWFGVKVLLVALGLSILIEWVGVHTVWDGQGASHSERMLERESRHIDSYVIRSSLTEKPVEIAHSLVASAADVLFIDEIRATLAQARANPHLLTIYPRDPVVERLRKLLRQGLHLTVEHLQIAVTVTQIFVVRLLIIAFSAPLFLIVFYTCIGDGLVVRELRKAGAGEEVSSFHHHAIAYLKFYLIVPFALYLGSPVSLNPAYVVAPVALVVGVATQIAMRTYKKHAIG